MTDVNMSNRQRLGLLLKMEWRLNKKNFFLLSVLLILISIGFNLLFFYLEPLESRYSSDYNNPLQCFFLFSIGYWLFFFFMLNGRVNRKETISYPVLPARVREKFGSYIIVAFLLLFFLWVISQFTAGLIFLAHPNLEGPRAFAPLVVLDNGYQIFNPFLFFSGINRFREGLTSAGFTISFILLSLGMTFLPAVSFRTPIKAILAFWGICIVLVVLFLTIFIPMFDFLLENFNSNVSVFFVIFCMAFLGGGMLVWSYSRLKNIQLR